MLINLDLLSLETAVNGPVVRTWSLVGDRTVTCRFQLLSAFVNGQWQLLPNLETSDFFFKFIYFWRRRVLVSTEVCKQVHSHRSSSVCFAAGQLYFLHLQRRRKGNFFAATTESTLQRQNQQQLQQRQKSRFQNLTPPPRLFCSLFLLQLCC